MRQYGGSPRDISQLTNLAPPAPPSLAQLRKLETSAAVLAARPESSVLLPLPQKRPLHEKLAPSTPAAGTPAPAATPYRGTSPPPRQLSSAPSTPAPGRGFPPKHSSEVAPTDPPSTPSNGHAAVAGPPLQPSVVADSRAPLQSTAEPTTPPSPPQGYQATAADGVQPQPAPGPGSPVTPTASP
jgi:hypothetical protein